MNISDLLKYPELAEIPKLKEQIKDIVNYWDKDEDEVFEIEVNNPQPDSEIIEEADEKLSKDELYEMYEVFNSDVLSNFWEEVNELLKENFEIVNVNELNDYATFKLEFNSLLSNEEIVNDLANLDEYLDELIHKTTPIEERIFDFRESIKEIKRGIEEFKKREKKQYYLKKDLEKKLASLYNDYSNLFNDYIKDYLRRKNE
jgi:thiamine kinase-like enzyme